MLCHRGIRTDAVAIHELQQLVFREQWGGDRVPRAHLDAGLIRTQGLAYLSEIRERKWSPSIILRVHIKIIPLSNHHPLRVEVLLVASYPISSLLEETVIGAACQKVSSHELIYLPLSFIPD